MKRTQAHAMRQTHKDHQTQKEKMQDALHGAPLTNCVDLLKDSKGVLGSVNADRLSFSWNVQNKIAAAPLKACNGLVALCKDSRCSNVYAAVHYCKLLAGYMGTATIRGFQAIGPHTIHDALPRGDELRQDPVHAATP